MSKKTGFFLVKKDNIYAKLESLLSGVETNTEQVKEFLKFYHIHIDPLGMIQYIRSKLANREVQDNEIVHQLLLHWVDTYPQDFAGESRRIELVVDMLHFLESPHALEYQQKLKEVLKQDPLFKPNRASQSTFDVISQQGTENIAKAIANHCRNLFEEIPNETFTTEAWKANPDHPVNKLLSYTSTVSSWAAASVISKTDRRSQAAILATFCEMLFFLYKTKNFTALLAVLKGLNKISIQRMSSVWKTLPSKSAANYELVDTIFSPGNNYENYRRKLQSSIAAGKNCFPCFEIFIIDIETLETTEDKVALVVNTKELSPVTEIPDSLRAFIPNLPSLSDDVLLELSLNLYKPALAEAQSVISEKQSFLFTYDKLTPTETLTLNTESCSSSEWNIKNYTHTEPPETKTPKKKSIFSSRAGLGGLYSRSAAPKEKVVLKVGVVNKYGYTLLCRFTDLKPEKGIRVKVNKKKLAIFLVNDSVYVMDDKCTHQDVPLSPGDIEEYKGEPAVKCPGHGLKFNLKTGACSAKKYTQPVYASKVKGEIVWGKLRNK